MQFNIQLIYLKLKIQDIWTGPKYDACAAVLYNFTQFSAFNCSRVRKLITERVYII